MKQKLLLCFLGVFLITLGACSPSKEQPKEQAKESVKVSTYKPDISFADAIKQSDEKAVKYYLEHDETPNQLDDDGNPFLVLATAQDNMKIFQDLLTAKAFMDTKNTKGENALWTAVNNGNYDIANLLIILGADVNTENQDNMTPLMVASQNGYILNVEQLLQNGANISVKNNQDKTALDLAKEQLNNAKDTDDAQTYREIVSMLKAQSEPVIPAAVKAIAASDINNVEFLAPRIKDLPKEKQARLLYMASQVCVPDTTQICHLTNNEKATEFPCIKNLVCNKENNAQIIRTLVKNGAPSNSVTLNYAGDLSDITKLDIFSVSYNLQKSNPELLNEIMPNLDKCMLALTQMSHPNPNEADDGLYATYWTQNKCSLNKMNILGTQVVNNKKNKPTITPLTKDAIKEFENLGITKEELTKKLGEPNFYQQKDNGMEVLTYREAQKNNIDPNTVNIVDDIYFIKHGVAVKKQHKWLADRLRPYVDRDKIAVYETKRGY